MTKGLEVEQEASVRWGDVSLYDLREEGSLRLIGRVVRVKNGKREEDEVELRQKAPAEGGLVRVLGALVGQRADLAEEIRLSLDDPGESPGNETVRGHKGDSGLRARWNQELAAYDLAIAELGAILRDEAAGKEGIQLERRGRLERRDEGRGERRADDRS